MSDLPLTFTVKCGEILLLEIRGIYRLCELLTRLIINMLEIDAPSDVLRLEKTNLLHINKLNIINAFDCRYPDSKIALGSYAKMSSIFCTVKHLRWL